MKTLILILAFTIQSFAQSDFLLLYGDDAVPTIDADNYFASLTTPLSSNRQDTITQMIQMFYDSLSITRLNEAFDGMWIHANETEESGLQNVVADSNHCTNVSSTAFAVDRGFTGDGAADYLNTNLIPSAANNYAQNSASIGTYLRAGLVAAANDYEMGCVDGSGINLMVEIMRADSTTLNAINSGVTDITTAKHDAAFGFPISTRTAVGVNPFYMDGVLFEAETRNSSGVPAVDVLILARNNNGAPHRFSPAQTSFSFIGKGFTADEVAKITNIVEWYLDAIGAGVL